MECLISVIVKKKRMKKEKKKRRRASCRSDKELRICLTVDSLAALVDLTMPRASSMPKSISVKVLSVRNKIYSNEVTPKCYSECFQRKDRSKCLRVIFSPKCPKSTLNRLTIEMGTVEERLVQLSLILTKQPRNTELSSEDRPYTKM